jgi:hypothetical protein
LYDKSAEHKFAAANTHSPCKNRIEFPRQLAPQVLREQSANLASAGYVC